MHAPARCGQAQLSLVGIVLFASILCSVSLVAQTDCDGARAFDFSVFSGPKSGVGHGDGPVAVANFNMPEGVAVDQNGNVFVADTANHVIRRITPSGEVTTWAGMPGVPGSTDGIGSAARFNSPRGIYVDTVDLIYVADYGNHTIRRIDSNRNVMTIAGKAGEPGEVDGVGGASRFNGPAGIIADLGDVVVTDALGHTIRYISPQLEVTTVGGQPNVPGHADGLYNNTKFNTPTGVAADLSGNIWVADSGNHVIRGLDINSGLIYTAAGMPGVAGSQDGASANARFNRPTAIRADLAGRIYILDSGNFTIRKATVNVVNLNVTTFAGAAGMSGYVDAESGADVRFESPSDLAVAFSGEMFVTERAAGAVRRIETTGATRTIAGSQGTTGSTDGPANVATFARPGGATLDSGGNLWLADRATHVLRKVAPDGSVTTVAGTAGESGTSNGIGAAARFNHPGGVAIDALGNVFVADTDNHSIRRVTQTGVVSTFAGMSGMAGSSDATGPAARFNAPQQLAFDGAGNLWVTDGGNATIRRITPAGVVTTVAGTAGATGSVDGVGAAARFELPFGVVVAADGSVRVSDAGAHTIRRIATNGSVTTIAGKAGETGSAGGEAASARFDRPAGLAMDASASLWIADRGNHVVRRLSPAGFVTTVGGEAGLFGTVEGIGPVAHFSEPVSVVAGAGGAIYVVSNLNGVIHRGTPITPLCIEGDRFAVSMKATDPRTGNTGLGLAIPQSDVFGYFAIPGLTSNPDNPEVFVKVLDGRMENGNFWVFYGGLTDFALDLVVTDTRGGANRLYRKEGRNFCGGADTSAFMQAMPLITTGSSDPRLTSRQEATCGVDALCLFSNRFTVTLQAKDPRTGNTGVGVPIPESALFGYFAIPDLTNNPGNPEVFVKLLDGRAENGRFWVFYGGLTDFEYTITVTDTSNGAVQTYTKAGGSYCGGADVLAFF